MADTEETQFPGLKDDVAPGDPLAPVPLEPRPVERISFTERLAERELEPVMVARAALKAHTRRDFLLYGAGAALAAAGFWWLLPEDTQMRLGRHNPQTDPRKERLLNKALTLDDDVAEFLYSPDRLAPTFAESLALPPVSDDSTQDELPGQFRINYEGGRPQALWGDYVPRWTLTLTGLASGRTETLRMPDIRALIARYGSREQVTRLVCVEGWSQIGQWSGLRFADLLAAHPPMAGARWAQLRSKYNIATDTDGNGNPVYSQDPYYVSIDMDTARHPQALLATEQSGKPLNIGHGAPLRLRVPMKLGLKNIKAISSIHYSVEEPQDYWASQGYSHYDGL